MTYLNSFFEVHRINLSHNVGAHRFKLLLLQQKYPEAKINQHQHAKAIINTSLSCSRVDTSPLAISFEHRQVSLDIFQRIS